jgi:hypothetical protein
MELIKPTSLLINKQRKLNLLLEDKISKKKHFSPKKLNINKTLNKNNSSPVIMGDEIFILHFN